jgi:predicted dehydrogenase
MIKIGIVGCGCISGIYIENLTKVFKMVEITAVADLIPERAEIAAKNTGARILKTDDLMNDQNVDIVLNLTTPPDHYEICRQALLCGKNVYVEKPFSVLRKQGADLMKIATEKGLYIGGAPDTFLGAGIQTCIKLIDDGWIGTPIGAVAYMTCHGHESWHPDPEFYYKKGAGPMFDMGPYYLTALTAMLGPAKTVMGMTSKAFDTRMITSEKKYGNIIEVEVPTHVNGLIRFQNGAVANIITSFDVWGANLPRIEIYGTLGSLSVPDPNTFGGPVMLKLPDSEWKEIPLSHCYSNNSRGLGLADMAISITRKKKARASGELVFHILDIMQTIHESSDTGKSIELTTTCSRPEPMGRGQI